jgi:hypothetical protein
MLPQRNATLTKVQGAGSGESYDGPSAGDPKWEAAADQRPNAYYRERRDRKLSGAGANRVLDRIVIVEAGRPEVDWKSGDVISVETAKGAITGTVKLIEAPKIPGVAGTVRLTLEEG